MSASSYAGSGRKHTGGNGESPHSPRGRAPSCRLGALFAQNKLRTVQRTRKVHQTWQLLLELRDFCLRFRIVAWWSTSRSSLAQEPEPALCLSSSPSSNFSTHRHCSARRQLPFAFHGAKSESRICSGRSSIPHQLHRRRLSFYWSRGPMVQKQPHARFTSQQGKTWRLPDIHSGGCECFIFPIEAHYPPHGRLHGQVCRGRACRRAQHESPPESQGLRTLSCPMPTVVIHQVSPS